MSMGKYIRSRDMLQAIAREARKYDVLGQPSAIRYVPASHRDESTTPHDSGVWQCAHGVWLDCECIPCGRYDHYVVVGEGDPLLDETYVLYVPSGIDVYVRAKMLRIKEVLKLLGMLPS